MATPVTVTTEMRNPVRLPGGVIDLEIKHPHYGWVPFTASPDDVELHGREIWAQVDAILKAQNPPA